eukprot:13317279-Heterocapsa_arctica.AAC.1
MPRSIRLITCCWLLSQTAPTGLVLLVVARLGLGAALAAASRGWLPLHRLREEAVVQLAVLPAVLAALRRVYRRPHSAAAGRGGGTGSWPARSSTVVSPE